MSADIEALAKALHAQHDGNRCIHWATGAMCERWAATILASDWLAEHDAQVRAEAWDEGYEQAGHDMGPYQYRETENPYRSNP